LRPSTSGNSPREENWIRQRLRSFLSIAEQHHLDELQSWSGNVSTFRESFPQILASVIDLDRAAKLQMEKIYRVQREKEKLQGELNRLGSQLESLKQRLEAGEISEAEFEARRAEIEPLYDRVQRDYIHASLFLSRTPSAVVARHITPEVSKKVEKIQEKFLKIRMEIEELKRKEQEGTITPADVKRRDKLQKEIVSLIKKLDKLRGG